MSRKPYTVTRELDQIHGKSCSSGFTPAQRAYLRSLIRREREILRDEVVEALNDALRSEAQLLFLRDQFPAERPAS